MVKQSVAATWAHRIRLCSLSLGASALLAMTGSAAAQTKLQFWDMIWGPPEYIEAAERIVAKFNKEHPGIQVEYRSIPWNNWYQTYVTAVSSNSAPDISTGAGYQAVQLSELGAIRPLDELIAEMRAEGDLDDFTPGTVDTLRYNGRYVALPWGLDIRVWYYRPSMLQAAGLPVPTTWAQLHTTLKAVTRANKYGVGASGDTNGSHYLLSAILNNGGGLFDEAGRLTFTSNPRNVEAIEWLSSLVAAGSVHPASAGFSADDRRAAFLRGEIAFAMDAPGFYKQGSDIAILPPLKGPHGDVGTIFWVNNVMMYEQTKHPKEAKAFLKWWSRNQLPLWTEGNSRQIPARKSFIKTVAADDEKYRFIVDNYIPIGKTTATSFKGIFPALSVVEGEGVLQTLTQQVFQGVAPAKAMTQAEARLKEIVAKKK